MRRVLTAATPLCLTACSAPSAAPPPAIPVANAPVPEATAQPPEPPIPLPPVLPTPAPDPFAACRHDPANVPALPKGTGLHTCGARILDASGNPVRITGVSWFGTSHCGPSHLP